MRVCACDAGLAWGDAFAHSACARCAHDARDGCGDTCEFALTCPIATCHPTLRPRAHTHALPSQPKLTDALLKKPPFRFLHDIISEVRRVSGFPGADVLTDFDMDSGNFKDKESKVNYLTKVIAAVSAAVGPVPVKPLKIVAGLEPENTNLLLQGLAKAASGGGAPEPRASPKEAPKKAPPPAEEAAPPPKKERPKPAEAEAEATPPARRARERAPPAQEEAAPPPRKEVGAERQEIGGGAGDDDAGRRMERPRTALRAPPRNAPPPGSTKDTRPTSKQVLVHPGCLRACVAPRRFAVCACRCCLRTAAAVRLVGERRHDHWVAIMRRPLRP